MFQRKASKERKGEGLSLSPVGPHMREDHRRIQSLQQIHMWHSRLAARVVSFNQGSDLVLGCLVYNGGALVKTVLQMD